MQTIMEGRIIKGSAGFYYVAVSGNGVFECKAKGIFRKDHKKPLVGDMVRMEILNKIEKKGNIIELLERVNELIRPAVANIDQALVVFACASPKINEGLLNRFLVQMELQNIETIICFNKRDLVSEIEADSIQQPYRLAGYQTCMISAKDKESIQEIRRILKGKITVLAGPSGVGKSTLVNNLQEKVVMQTGELSAKIERGKHTTRHSEFIQIEEDTFLFDTPGFSSIAVTQYEKEEMTIAFREFHEYEPFCKFPGCAHIHEPNCGVKDAVDRGDISKLRYEQYLNLYEECKDKRRF